MSNKYEAKAIYDEMIHDVTTSEKKWQDVCRLTGQIYRFEFDNILMVYGQRPQSTMIADYDTWKKVERYVKRGSKGIAIFPSRALNPRMRYVFDISDTGGKKQKLTWDLEGENLKDYLDYLVSEGQMEQYEGTTREELLNSLKLFTGTNVWSMIRTDFEERISELSQLAGSMIKELNYETSGLTTDDLVYQSVMYAVGTRCGFDLSMQEQDFSQIVKITDEEVIYRLGSLVCDVSCSVLREFSRNLKTIESERRIAYGRINNDVSRSGRTTVSGYSDAGRAGSEINESREIRNTGDELSKGERTSKAQDTLPIRETGRENERGERGSLPTARPADERLPEETQTRESEFHDGDVETERTGEDAGRGSSASADRHEISLEADEELNRELNAFYERKLYYRENSHMYQKEVNATVEDRIRLLDEIRNNTRHLIDIQTDGCSEEELAEGQKTLNATYDAFVEKYGYITAQANSRAFRDDSDYPLLCSLEDVNEDGIVKKADMFFKQTIKAKVQIERVETAVEALNVSINEYGSVNIPYMLSIYHPDLSKLIEELVTKRNEPSSNILLSDDVKAELERAVMLEELQELIYLNPNRYNENNPNAGWETADDYLSGNVREKLRVAKAMRGASPELFAQNIQALEQIQPKDIEASEIDQ